MSSRNIGSVALVILLGLIVGVLGLFAADLYAVGVLILFLGGVGAAVLAGEYFIRYLSGGISNGQRLGYTERGGGDGEDVDRCG